MPNEEKPLAHSASALHSVTTLPTNTKNHSESNHSTMATPPFLMSFSHNAGDACIAAPLLTSLKSKAAQNLILTPKSNKNEDPHKANPHSLISCQ